MARKRREKVKSNNFCILCGRYTSDKKFASDNWTNFFFSCSSCKNVWCSEHMAQVKNEKPNRTYRLGKKGGVTCPDCGNPAIMSKLPKELPFIQQKFNSNQQEAQHENKSLQHKEEKICDMCGQKNISEAAFCNYCGSKQ